MNRAWSEFWWGAVMLFDQFGRRPQEPSVLTDVMLTEAFKSKLWEQMEPMRWPFRVLYDAYEREYRPVEGKTVTWHRLEVFGEKDSCDLR